MAINHLAKVEMKPCGPTNPCDPDPEMLLTVTGSSGTVNWCGQTWNLPADSGVEKSVCPTVYEKGRYFTSLGGYGSEYHAYHEWHHNNSLRLEIRYWIWLFSGTNQWFRDGFQNNDHYIRLGVTGGPFIDRLGVEGTNQPKPRPVFGSFLPTSAHGQLDMGVLSAGMPTQTYNNYGLTNQWFGSHTAGGITYAWSKGLGW